MYRGLRVLPRDLRLCPRVFLYACYVTFARSTAAEKTSLGCEETEFSIRLRRLSPGARIIYEPRAVVYHHVDHSRATWRYFLGRCRAEGYSKARVSRLSGASAALSSERSYVTHTITRAVRSELIALPRPRRKDSMMRLAALSLGTLSATAGYMMEMALQSVRGFGNGSPSTGAPEDAVS